MDWSPLWSFLGAAVPVGIGMALVKNYLPSYMNEKGKNLATKQDIGAITKAVEDVKHEYAGKLEEMRSTLAYSMSRRASIKEREVEALIRYFELLTELRTEQLLLDPGEFMPDNGASLIKYRQQVTEHILKAQSQFIRVKMYHHRNPNLLKSLDDTYDLLGEIRIVFMEHFPEWATAMLRSTRPPTRHPRSNYEADDLREEARIEFAKYTSARKPILEKFDNAVLRLTKTIHSYLNENDLAA